MALERAVPERENPPPGTLPVRLIGLVRSAVVALNAAATGDFGAAADIVMARLGTTLGAQRVRIFRFDNADRRFFVSRQWAAVGVEPARSSVEVFTFDERRWWVEPLIAGAVHRFDDPASIPDERGRDSWRDQGLRSILVVSMRSGGRTIGALDVHHLHAPFVWSARSIEVVQTIADVLGGARDRDDLAVRVAHEAQSLRALTDMVAWGLGQQLGPALYQGLLDRVADITPEADGGSIVLRSDDGVYRYVAARGYDLQQLQRVAFAAEELQHPRELREATQYLAPYEGNLALLGEQRSEVLESVGRAGRIASTLVVPLVTGELPLGFMYLDGLEAGRSFSDDSVAIASVAASQASLVIQRLTLDATLRARQQAFERLATVDALTGLPNRHAFIERLPALLAQAQRHERRLALLYLDLDGFKAVNDSLGHDQGDALLRTVGRRLRAAVRSGDLVARLGGDEFTVVINDLHDASEAAAVAVKLVDAVRLPVALGSHSVRVSTSVGIALYPDDASSPVDLMRRADTAMYGAKHQGRDGYHFFTSVMESDARARLELVSDLHDALDSGSIEVVYQPRVRLSDGRWVGVEALARWRHPTRGMVSPVVFVPLAAETGLIDRLGAHVADHACGMLARWQGVAALAGVRVSVNVSLRELQRGDLHERLASALERHGVAPERLEVELTETAVMLDLERHGGAVDALHTLGVKIALDDFGTAYSSLAQLKRIPLDVVKIDRRFSASLGDAGEAADASIIDVVLRLGRSFGFSVVAEGIERDRQRQRLLALGCSFGQGFYFAHPMRADELEGRAAQHAPA